MLSIISICLTTDCVREEKWKLPSAFLVTSLLYELLSTQSMNILSGLYRAVSSKDSALFEKTLFRALIIVFALAVLKAIANYFNDLCAIQWRRYLVERIHTGYSRFSIEVQSKVVSDVSTKDQRITQDVDRLTTKSAELVASVIVLPAVILYYTFYLLLLFGWMAPVSCFLYFLLGATVCYVVAARLVDVVCAQEQLEGEFRQRHFQAQQHAQEVHLLRGEEEETRQMQAAFTALFNNSCALALRKFWVNVCTHWFAYAGAIVNYVIIGVAIFYVHGGDAEGSASSADRVALLAQGSYACMYLISALSTIIGSSESVSEVVGLARRVSELLYKLQDSGAERKEATHVLSGWAPPRTRHDGEADRRRGTYLPLADLEGGDRGVEMKMTAGSAGEPSAEELPHGTYAAPLPGSDKTNIEVMYIDCVDVMCEANHVVTVSPFRDEAIMPHRVLIRQLSLRLRWGMRVLVTGPSGCGKSTLLRLIARAARAQTGGANLERVPGVTIGVTPELLVVCPQTPHLFKGTLEDNLLYPRSAHSVAATSQGETGRLRQVLEAVGMSAFADSLRSGEPRDWAATTSPGERQRLAVARAILQRPPLVLLDEISSALDEPAESVLYRAVAAFCPTFLSLGHRSSLRQFHSHELHINVDGGYSFSEIV